MNQRPHALITGASRKIGIAASIARALARSGWDISLSYWRPYDKSMSWGSNDEEILELEKELKAMGCKTLCIEADLSCEESPEKIIEQAVNRTGPLTALILSHCYSVDSTIQNTSIQSFDTHFSVNARASWLLIKHFCSRFIGAFGSGRIVSITSDHVAGNMPYGASKGAMDRIVIAAAEEHRDLGITANVINPGATDTGWMNEELEHYIKKSTFLNRIGTPEDCANLVEFLCSPKGGWINGQVLCSNGGVHYS